MGHVVLSFVIWFLLFQGALWTLAVTRLLNVGVFSIFLGWLGFYLSVSGTLCVIIAALFGLGIPFLLLKGNLIDLPWGIDQEKDKGFYQYFGIKDRRSSKK